MPNHSRGRLVPATAPNCFTCRNRDKAEWCVLADEHVELLDKAKHPLAFDTGQTLFRQGEPWDGLYCIESGTVAMRLTNAQGNSILLRLSHAGQTVGYRGFFDEGAYACTAEVVQPATACRIDGESLRAVLAHNPALGLQFLGHLSQELDQTEESLLQQSSVTVRIRLAYLLLSFKERFGAVGADGVLTIDLPVARQDMAALLGTRPETIARAIHGLETDSVVQFDGRRAIVHDLDCLLDEIEPLSA